MNISIIRHAIALIFCSLVLSCEKENMQSGNDINNPESPKGTLSLSITDAPIDQAGINGAFITVTEIQIDGKRLSGFQGPKTFNLLELQNGKVLNLGRQEAAANTYSEIKLILDIDKDASGASPGCYLARAGGVKEKLEISGSNKAEIDIKSQNLVIVEDGTTEMIIDFDLRKAVRLKDNKFSFVTQSELNAAVRAESITRTGTIKGKVDNFTSLGSSIVVYAYKKGTFESNKELNGQGSSEVKFAGSVSSAKADASGNFTLAFLPAGEYEIYVDKPAKDGLGLGLNTLLETTSSANLNAVGLSAGAEVSLSLSVKIGSSLPL